MAEEGFRRKLTAILSADVEGYSRLMGEDEDATIRTLTTYRELMSTLIQKHRGRVVDSPGDNLLAEFLSVVDAVRCAVEIQEELRVRNAELPENRSMEFRIGVNLGDVVEQGERIYGDGVNITARVEGLAERGGICISGTVYDSIKNKLSLGYESLGEHTVKNIKEPVRVYRMRIGPEAAAPVVREDQAGPRGWRIPAIAAAVVLIVAVGAVVWQVYLRKPSPQAQQTVAPGTEAKNLSIVVLPFDNLSGDPDQDYFADGLTEDLITDLSRIRGSFVIARGTSFTYKGKPVDAKEVAEELKVRYVLEGSVRRDGNVVRVNAQLIDGETGGHIWSERFDREMKDVFSLQDEVTGRIAAVLRLELLEAESRRLQRGPPANLKAWDYALRAWAEIVTKTLSEQGILEAQRLLQKALELDPNSALAWIAMTRVHANGATSGWGTTSKDESRRLMLETGQKAVALDPKSADAHRQLGFAYRFHRQLEKAMSACQTAVELNPNHSDAYECLANAKVALGRPAEALPLFEKAIRLSPRVGRPARRYFFVGVAHLMAGNFEQAVKTIEKGISANPKFPAQYWVLTSAFGHLGWKDEAEAALADFNRVDKGRRDSIAKMRKQYDYIANFEHVLEGLRRAGMKE